MNREKKPHILVAGAHGFIGSALFEYFRRKSLPVIGTVRGEGRGKGLVSSPCLSDREAWFALFGDCDVVVHAAARVPARGDTPENSLTAFREINEAGTLNLARQAAAAGVRRFIFLSTVKVNGERTADGKLFTETDPPAPEDAYARSKTEAEEGLRSLAATTGLEVVIIRPPLVYGPGVKGNFAGLMQLVERGWSLPLGAVNNRRSLIGLDNLVDFIDVCVDHPAAGNQTFLVTDGEDLSTTDLLRRLGQAMDKPARLIPVPMSVLNFGARLLGKQALAQRLCGNLQVDISKARQLMGWEPPVSVDEGLRRAVENWRGGEGER